MHSRTKFPPLIHRHPSSPLPTPTSRLVMLSSDHHHPHAAHRRTGIATPTVQWTVRSRDSPGDTRADLLIPRASAPDSARKLAASLWRLVASCSGSGTLTWRYGLFDRVFEFCSSATIPKWGMEEATKWDYYYTNGVYGFNDVRSSHNRLAPMLKTKENVDEIKSEGGLRRRLNSFRFKESGRSSMQLIVKNLVTDIKRERRKSRKLYVVNSKLRNDICGARLSAKKFLQNMEKEKKGRALLEKDCLELAKYVDSSKAEIGALRDQRARIQEEIKEERQMLQMAEVWREERVQMKLADAKSILENKLAKINNLIVDCEAIMQPSSLSTHCSSNVQRAHLHDRVSDTTRKIGHRNGTKSTSGKETITQAHASEGTVNKTQSTENMFACDANCRKKALSGSQSLQSNEISSVTLMHSTKKGSSSVHKTGGQNHSNSSISSTKYQSSPKKALIKRDYYDNNPALPHHQWRSIGLQRNPERNRGGHQIISSPQLQRHNITTRNLLKHELVSRKMLVRDLLEQRDSSAQSSIE